MEGLRVVGLGFLVFLSLDRDHVTKVVRSLRAFRMRTGV